MSLFQKQDIVLNSGQKSDFKIECDALTDKDWECLAYLISRRVSFDFVQGVPTGGNKLAEALKKYTTNTWTQTILIVDDVLTTGGSMERMKAELQDQDKKGMIVRDVDSNVIEANYVGFVVFARGKCPDWIKALFTLNE